MENHNVSPLLMPVWEVWDYYGNFSKMPKSIRADVTLSHLQVDLTVFGKRLTQMEACFQELNDVKDVWQSTHNDRRTLILELSPVWEALHHHQLKWLEVVEPKRDEKLFPFGLIYVWREPRPSPCKPLHYNTMRRETLPIRRTVQAKHLTDIFRL